MTQWNNNSFEGPLMSQWAPKMMMMKLDLLMT